MGGRHRAKCAAAGKPQHIAEVLENEIRSGRLAHGARLQSESELVRRFAVSRSTVRKGLSALSTRGLIRTSVGIGSFVTYDGNLVTDDPGWTRALEKAGANAVTETLCFEMLEDAALAATLGLDDARFVALDRVRRDARDGHAISIERSKVPVVSEIAELPKTGLLDGSLTRTLRAAGLFSDHGEEWIDVTPLSDADAQIARRAPGTMFLRTRRVFRTHEGRAMEHVTSLLNPAHFALHREF